MKKVKEKLNKKIIKKTSVFDSKIKELLRVLDSYEYDELSLRDLYSLDDILENIFDDIKRIKDDLIYDRLYQSFEDAKRF